MKKIVLYSLVTGLILLDAIAIFPRGVVQAGDPSASRSNTTATNTFVQEQNRTEVNQRKLLTNQPSPQIENSQERANLIERINRFNNTDKVSYIYLISFGKVMAFHTVKGKVSSVNSWLTNPQQIISKEGNPCNNFEDYSERDCYVVESPSEDGSYGSNGDAIFFFTTDGIYVEWNGEYMLADQPLQMTTQPELIRQIK